MANIIRSINGNSGLKGTVVSTATIGATSSSSETANIDLSGYTLIRFKVNWAGNYVYNYILLSDLKSSSQGNQRIWMPNGSSGTSRAIWYYNGVLHLGQCYYGSTPLEGITITEIVGYKGTIK